MRWLLVSLAWFCCTPHVLAVEVDYRRDIKPLLIEKCSACHGALRQQAELRLDAGSLIHKGGESGAAVVPGKATESPLFQRVTASDVDDRMPPEGEGEPLNPQQLAMMRAWIEAGATIPDDEPIPLSPSEHWAYQVPLRPAVPKFDAPEMVAWSENPLDAFVAAQHHRASLQPVELAAKNVLVRRLYFDLVGLPPTRQQLDEFLADDSADAYSKLVDRLLDSPQYGERWGRHWMDVWRYSDWDGYKNQLRGSQRHIWRWRDWIVQSLNADKGYDQMILEMLAGDELAPDDMSVLPATGFLARSYHKSNRNIWLDATVEHTAKAFLGMTINCARCHDHKFDPLKQSEYYAMRAIFEPHNVRTERVPGQPDLQKDGLPRVFDAEPEVKTFLYIRGNEKHFDKEKPIAAATPEILGRPIEVNQISLPPVSVFPALWPHIEQEDIQAAEKRVVVATRQLEKISAETGRLVDGSEAEDGAEAVDDTDSESVESLKLAAAKAELDSLRARWAADKAKYLDQSAETVKRLAKVASSAERQAAVQAAKLQVWEKRSIFSVAEASAEASAEADAEASAETEKNKKQAAVKKALGELKAAEKKLDEAISITASQAEGEAYTSVGKAHPRTSTGRRLALSRWIADSNNPLTARVAVNHIWMRHFGEPLVSNVFDFGLRSPEPTHVDLLDWLAVELMEHDWSMKHVHRLIVTSRVYQLASSTDSAPHEANRQIDPDNRLLWRANVRRLDAEVIRDSMLHVASSLDLTPGGPEIEYAQGEIVPRRSIYIQHAYEKQMTMLTLFDAAGPNECYRRSRSIVPQQALTLANSALSHTESRKLARALWKQVAGESATEKQATEKQATEKQATERRFVNLAFRQMLARDATEAESQACRQFLARQAGMLAKPATLNDFGGTVTTTVDASPDPAMRARENLVHVLMNHNDFVTVR